MITSYQTNFSRRIQWSNFKNLETYHFVLYIWNVNDIFLLLNCDSISYLVTIEMYIVSIMPISPQIVTFVKFSGENSERVINKKNSYC